MQYNSSHLPISLKSTHSIPLEYDSFSSSTVDCHLSFPSNSLLESIEIKKDEIHFTNDNPFSFSSLDSKKESIFMKPEELPINDKRSRSEQCVVTTEYFKGEPQLKHFDNTRDGVGSMGFLRLPPVFLLNGSDYLPDDVEESKKVTTLSQIEQCQAPNNIILANIENARIHHLVMRSFMVKLSSFYNIEILSLRSSGITEMPDGIFPKLRIADFCDNRIESPFFAISFAQKQPVLTILDYRRNPISQNEGIRLEITASSVNLKFLNGRPITIHDRILAMEHYPQRFKPSDIPKLHFFYQIKQIPEISILRSWDPGMIQHLSLPSCGLTTFCAHLFRNLLSLNLSNNNIQKLDDTGIILCRHLLSLDLRGNRIENKEEFEVFKYIDTLLHLWLEGNLVEDYRSYVVYKCRRANGTAAKNGLKSLDGIPVTINETLRSMHTAHKDTSAKSLISLKWKNNIERTLGNTRLAKDNHLIGRVRHLQFVNRGINELKLGHFTSLTHLNLRGNFVRSIYGISQCTNLVFLDISHNFLLDMEMVIPELVLLKKLQVLLIAKDCWKPELDQITSYDVLYNARSRDRSVHNKQYREGLLSKLIPAIPSLASLDRLNITVPERIGVISQNGMNEERLEQYRVDLSIVQSICFNNWIDLSPEKINTVPHFQHEEVVTLRNLRGCGLKSIPSLQFRMFINLEELDLSRNTLSTLSHLCLESCSKLRLLDVSFNNISDTPEEVGHLIDHLPSLQMMSIRGNPVVNSNEKRKQLISSIERLQQLNDCFRVLDCELAPIDVVNSKSYSGPGSDDIKRRELFALSLKIKLPFQSMVSQLKELSLENCSLQYADLSRFVSLSSLSLSNNLFTTHEEIIGLQELHSLKLLNIRNNKFKTLGSFVFIISWCSKLSNIGILGNPCVEKSSKYRSKIISHLPMLSSPNCPFLAIDDVAITPDEIRHSVKSGIINEENFDKFCFDLALNRNKPGGDILDLSNSNLHRFLDLSAFDNLKLISLSHNHLSTKTIMQSGISRCPNLEFIDVSHNNLKMESDHKVSLFFSAIISLRRLEVYHNPACNNLDDWREFLLHYPRISEVGCPLRIINGHELTLDDRVKLVREQSRSEQVAESFKCEFILYQHSREWTQSRGLFLSRLNLVSVMPLVMTTQLQVLDLSHNKIRKLSGQGFDKLKSLTILDIHDNEIESIEDIRSTLIDCPSLQRLYMKESTSDKSLTQNPKFYVGYICHFMRGLQEVDKFLNHRPLKANQLNSLKDIQQITGWYNPNHIHDIDLSNRNLTIREFTSCLLALEALGPRVLTFTGNPCTEIDKYRYLVIFHVPDVQIIDGSLVTIDQRMNADKSLRVSKAEGVLDRVAINAALVGAEYMDVEDRHSTLNYVKKFSEYAVKYGTALMKWEIFITFQQILGQIIALVDRVKWPKIYLDFSWIVFPFTIDLSFLSYLLDIRLPFWYNYATFFTYILVPALLFCLYHFQPNQDYWYNVFTTGIKRTTWLSVLAFIMVIICGGGLSLLADFNYTYATKKFSNNQYAWFSVLSFITFVLFVLFWYASYKFYKNSDDPVIWFKAMKFKKRSALFILNVLYFPVCKSFMDTFVCVSGHIKNFDEVTCASSFDSIQLIHSVSMIFGLIYAIGIPVFFIRLINKGVREIDLNYKIDIRLEQLHQKKEEVERMEKEGQNVDEMKKQNELTEEEIKTAYAQAAIEYENAAAYLYNAYDRPDRYKKVISMIEKLGYLIISSFFPKQLFRTMMSSGLMFVMSVWQIVSNPFNAISENVLEGIGKVFSFVTLLFGTVFQLDIVKTNSSTHNIAGMGLVGLALVLFVLFIFFLIKNNCCSQEVEEPTEDAKSCEEEEMEDIGVRNEMVEALKSLRIGDGTLRRGRLIAGVNSKDFWKDGGAPMPPEYGIEDGSDHSEGNEPLPLLDHI